MNHNIVVDEPRPTAGDSVRLRFHCTGGDLSGSVQIRPAARADEFVALLREQHETGDAGRRAAVNALVAERYRLPESKR